MLVCLNEISTVKNRNLHSNLYYIYNRVYYYYGISLVMGPRICCRDYSFRGCKKRGLTEDDIFFLTNNKCLIYLFIYNNHTVLILFIVSVSR